MTELVVIRGNSASGKTSLAKLVQAKIPASLLVSQDVLRIDMLQVKDRPQNLAIPLIQQTVLFGIDRVDVVILEGILRRDVYGDMLTELGEKFSRVAVYYLDVPLQTTLARHAQRPEAAKFSADHLIDWYRPHDQLSLQNETNFDESWSLNQMAAHILQALKS
ncbi:MAG TPA: AAA family ATPase [Lactobacillaceae bacterium]|jgi:adenylate kinase family enzyme